jgi:N-acyl-D-aspartate/D-glutamate deacylase
LRADLNAIDYDNLSLDPPTVTYDLPAGGRRVRQRAHGYVATLVAGEVISRNDEDTGARPGRLIRGGR